MLDIKLLRENPEIVKKNLEKRNALNKIPLVDEFLKADKKWRELLIEANQLRQRRNEISLEIAKLKKQKKDIKSKLNEAEELPKKIKRIESQLAAYENRIHEIHMSLPNILHESVPEGKDENDNVELRKIGFQPKFDFTPKNHLDILKDLDLIDDVRAEKAAGHGFFYLKGQLVLLDYAILRFALDFMIKKGYTPIEPPYMIRKKAFEGATDLDTIKDQIYKIENEDLYLIGTAEHPLASMLMDEVLKEEDLPLKFCGISPCFRKEVGTHGKYTKGLFRMHQFNKIEQFIFCKPEDSWKYFDELQQNAEELLRKLGLHCRVVLLCSGETGFVQAKTLDTEIWMADGKFREEGSCSNVTDFQARRLNIKYRKKEGQAPAGYVHTLNNTALATSRIMLAILEQFQQNDGSVIIPEPLRVYMGGVYKLQKK